MSAAATQNDLSPAPADTGLGRRAIDVTVTILSLGTNKLIARGTGWLTRNGLVRYVVPALVLNEAFGAYRAFVAGGALGWW
jgi:hypothetical protein